MKFIDEMIELSESYVNSDIEWLKRHIREAAQEGRRETTVFFENDKIKVAEKWCED